MPEEQYKVTNYKKKLGAYDFNTIIILYHCDIVINRDFSGFFANSFFRSSKFILLVTSFLIDIIESDVSHSITNSF